MHSPARPGIGKYLNSTSHILTVMGERIVILRKFIPSKVDRKAAFQCLYRTNALPIDVEFLHNISKIRGACLKRFSLLLSKALTRFVLFE